jgi:hypothetical protein
MWGWPVSEPRFEPETTMNENQECQMPVGEFWSTLEIYFRRASYAELLLELLRTVKMFRAVTTPRFRIKARVCKPTILTDYYSKFSLISLYIPI